MSTVKIESLGKEIELLPYTHKIARAYKNALLSGVVVSSKQVEETPNIDLPITNQLLAQEIQIIGLTGLSQSDLDAISEKEFDMLVEAVNEHIAEKKSK